MHDREFKIASKATAKRLFPKRLRGVADRAHGYDPGDDYGLNADIAERVGVTRGAVTRWMAGVVPRISTILALADAYNTSPDYLVGNDEREKQFSLQEIESRLPYDAMMRVLRIMSEVRRDMKSDPPDELIAAVSVEVMQAVERDPNMPEDDIAAEAYRLLRKGISPTKKA